MKVDTPQIKSISWRRIVYALLLPVLFSGLALFLLQDIEHLVLSGVIFTFGSMVNLDFVVLILLGSLFFAIDPFVWRVMVKRNGGDIAWRKVFWRSALIQGLALFTPGNIIEIWMRKVGVVSKASVEGLRLYVLKLSTYLLWSASAATLFFFPGNGIVWLCISICIVLIVAFCSTWRFVIPLVGLYSLRLVLLCAMHLWVLCRPPLCTSITFSEVILSHSLGGSIPSLPFFAPSVKSSIFSALESGNLQTADFLISGQTIWFSNWFIAIGVIVVCSLYALYTSRFRSGAL